MENSKEESMGTIHFIGCKKCKVYRDLDKFYHIPKITTREEAKEYAEDVKNKFYFQAALFITFAKEHQGHDINYFTEHDDLWDWFRENAEEQSEQFWSEKYEYLNRKFIKDYPDIIKKIGEVYIENDNCNVKMRQLEAYNQIKQILKGE